MSNFCKNIHNIPLLPVPDLNQTMDQYLEWLKPLVDETQLQATNAKIQEFLNSKNSETIQNALINKAKNRDSSWLAEWWIENAYLVSRGPVTPECNAGLEIVFDFDKNLNVLQRIAVFMHSLAKVYVNYKNSPNDYFEIKGKKISLDQVNGIFASMRLFGETKDSYYINNDFSEHLVWLFKNNLYNIQVINNNKVVSVNEIYNTLCTITNNASSLDVNVNFVSATCNRSEGAKIYEALLVNNRENLQHINNAIAVISYDDITIDSYDASINNTYSNACYFNRWLGKGLSVIFTNNTCSIIGDHTYIDGGTEIYIVEQVNQVINEITPEFSGDVQTKYQELKFDIENQKEILANFRTDFENYLSTTKYSLIEFEIDRVKLKEQGILSLDGFMQILFQYAHKQAFKEIVPTYESVDVRNFFRGRTECLRPVSTQSVKVVEMIESRNSEKLQEAIIASTNEHYKRLKNCQNGHGVNRHLLGLDLMAKELAIDVELFADDSYKLISNNRISTSSLTNRLVKYFYFQQVSDDGFGISYQLGDQPKIIISSKNELATQRSKFVQSFNEVLAFLKTELNCN